MGVVICVIEMRAGHLIMLERSIVNQIPVDEFTAAVVVNAPDSEVEAWQELFVPCFDIAGCTAFDGKHFGPATDRIRAVQRPDVAPPEALVTVGYRVCGKSRLGSVWAVYDLSKWISLRRT